MTKKEPKSAKSVEKSTKPEEPSETVSSEQPQEAPSEAPVISLEDFDPKKVAMAEEMGIPIKKLVDWVNVTEVRLQILAKSMPNQEQMTKAMEQAIQNAQQRQREEYAKAVAEGRVPKGGGGGGIGLGDILKIVGGGGGGSDEEMVKLTKDMMRVNIDAMKTDIGFSKAIKNALVAKITGKAIGEAAKSIIE